MSRQVKGIMARLLVVGLFLTPVLGFSQLIEVGGAFGGMLYTGDVAPVLNPKFVRPGGGLFFRYNPTRSFAARAQVSLGRIIGTDSITNDAYQLARGAAFRNTIREVALLGEYKFRNYTPLRNVKNWTPYVFGGLAVFSHGLRQPGDKPVQIAFPLGVGVKYEIARPWSIGLEYTTRFTTTDNLDGLGTPPAGAPKLNQSDPDRKDHYTMVFLTVSYTFYRVFCPPGSN
ncbi:type IX secretion system protein PorG [Fibrella forsythiae]|nr:DUF6089 family protein [Fibrella forsythiae]